MNRLEGNVLEYLVEDVDGEEYDPNEFYEEAITHLSTYGYDVAHEIIWDFNKYEASGIDGDHFEVIAKLDDEENSSYLRFVLEDGRPDKQAPALERVNGPEDFDYDI